jgi:murein DD-endopeptidase MepM/ murein hydrolase activator NlpD
VVRPHRGVDIAAPAGTPILATAAGTVRFAGEGPRGYGLMVDVDHGFGIVSRFAHASRLLVRAGQHVEAGHRIALVGATGLATGPHLHYEVLVHGQRVDPASILPAGALAAAPFGSGRPVASIATSGD